MVRKSGAAYTVRMAVRLRSMRACGEVVAIFFGLGGAALTMALSSPGPVTAPVLAPSVETYEVELVDMPERPTIRCARSYSTVQSTVEVFDRPEDLALSCGGVPCTAADFITLETAVCFAEEHYLGEGHARLVHFEVDERYNAPMWVIMGVDGEVVSVAAQR